jgi:putative salt-induced outer membrane protein
MIARMHTVLPRLFLTCGAALAFALAGNTASAAPEEPMPDGTVGAGDPASKGTTDLEGLDAMGSAAEVEAEEDESKPHDATEFDIGAGGILNTGNSRSLAMTAASNLRIRRTMHQFSANLAGNYGRSALERGGPWLETAKNVQGRVRYDIFFAHRWSAFLMATNRHDVFQGVDYRLNLDPGVAFYAIHKRNHRLWFEAGYDFEYEIRTNEHTLEHDDAGNIVLDDEGRTNRVLAKTESNHAARLFAGYVNKVNERVSLTSGFEYLQSFLDAKRFRMNFELGLASQIKDRFSINTTFTLRYDNEPLPTVEKLDTVTSLLLSYRFF